MTSPLLWNLSALFPTAAFLLNGFVLTYVFAQHNKSPVNRAFMLLSTDAAVWLGFELLLYLPIARGYEIPICRIGSASWIFIGFFFLNFANAVAQRKGDIVLVISFVFSAVVSLLTMVTDWMVTEVPLHSWGPGPVAAPFAHIIVSIGVGLFALYGGAIIVKKRRRTADAVERKIIGLILGGTAVSSVFIVLFDVVIPDILDIQYIPRYGAQSMAVFMLVVFYAVMKYRFLSISLDKAAEGIFKEVKVGILLLDRDGIVHRANKEAAVLFGPSIEGRAARSLFLGHDISGEFFNREIPVEEGNLRRVFSLSSSVVSEQERPLGTILMVQDITDQKNAEDLLRKSRDDLEKEVIKRTRRLRQAQRLETIGTLAGGIAHDFNNCLAAVLGFTKAAYIDLPENSPIRTDLEEVILAANRGRDMVQQMLSLARKEDRSDFKVTNMTSLVYECLDRLSISTPPDISVRAEISVGHPMVNCSATQITQVITNLYNNACHALKGCERRELTIVLDNVEISDLSSIDTVLHKIGTYVRLVVRDTGVGIREENLSSIFDPFFTTKGRGEGTGLGLSSAQMIIQNHDGEITVKSELNLGTSFTVLLPAHSEESRRTSVPPSEYSTAVTEGKDEHILWVDDEPQMLRMGKRTLSPLGYRVTVAENGDEALEIFNRDPNFFDLVITDYNMPKMNGCELAASLKSIKPSLPIVLISGLGDTLPVDEIELSGVDISLSKPVEREMLGRTIRSMLDR